MNMSVEHLDPMRLMGFSEGLSIDLKSPVLANRNGAKIGFEPIPVLPDVNQLVGFTAKAGNNGVDVAATLVQFGSKIGLEPGP
ncbi:MAG: hypothetical protein AAGI11_19825 [Pseudomonadota bacterium]